jgi:hypothetical protein
MAETDTPAFKGNEFISGDSQRKYYETLQELKQFPPLAKIFVGRDLPPDSGWLQAICILQFLQLKQTGGVDQ